MRVLIIALITVFTSSFGYGQVILKDSKGSLSKRWLIQSDTITRFRIEPYKPVYFLFANYTTDINNFPVSDNPLNSVDEPSEFSETEFKFQLSFKTRAVRNLFGKKLVEIFG